MVAVRTSLAGMADSWKRYDKARAKPRLNVVMATEVRAMAEKLAEKRGGSVSALLEALVIEEYSRQAKKERRTP